MAPDDRRDGKERRTQNPPSEAGSVRLNKYFVPRDGIEREVITSEICRYLGNDALVRPGNYENPQTRKIQQGYFIEARKNLTTAMIADLKADSEGWSAEKFTVEYRVSTTHQSRGYFGRTSESSTVPAQSDDDVYEVPGPDIKTSSDSSDGVANPSIERDPPIERGPEYGEASSVRAIRMPPTPSTEIQGTSYGADSASFMSPEAARRPGFEKQPTINPYGAQIQLCKSAGRLKIAESITKAAKITSGTIGTVGSVGVGSAYYTSRQANAQNEAKPAWEREQAGNRERFSEREAASERQEQGLREWESALAARERTLQVDLRELDHRAQRRDEAIRKKEIELEKRSKEYVDWGKELHKVKAEIMKAENELKERSEELRRDTVKLRDREDELNGKEKKELKKIDAGIRWMEIEVTQRSEELGAREEKLQYQQCNCCHRDTEPASNINSRPSSTIGDEAAMSTLSATPLETSSWTILPRMEQECNQTDSSPSLVDENSAPNPQSTSVPTSMVRQASFAATKTSSQIIATHTQDTESPVSSEALAPSKPSLSEIKAQLSIDKKLDLPGRIISKDVKT